MRRAVGTDPVKEILSTPGWRDRGWPGRGSGFSRERESEGVEGVKEVGKSGSERSQ